MWQVEYYEAARGRRPVEDFIDSLDAKSKAKVVRTIDLLQEFGVALGMPYAKHLEHDLWELRARIAHNQYRVIYFLASGRSFVLLHGFAKKSARVALSDLEAARERRADFLRRRRQP